MQRFVLSLISDWGTWIGNVLAYILLRIVMESLGFAKFTCFLLSWKQDLEEESGLYWVSRKSIQNRLRLFQLCGDLAGIGLLVCGVLLTC